MKTQYYFHYFIISFLAMSCSSKKLFSQSQGVLVINRHLFEPDTTIVVKFRILYLNNQSIQEVPQLNIIEDSLGKRNFTKILHFGYLNTDENVCFNYVNFSDTARVIQYYNNIDSIGNGGGWNFYSNKKFQYDNLSELNDTLIDNVNYKRIQLNKIVGVSPISFHVFIRCDKSKVPVSFFKLLSTQIGCPIARVDTYKGGRIITSSEIQYISDTLSKKQLRVFEKWESNVKNYLDK